MYRDDYDKARAESFEGEAIDIDEHGALLVHRDGGEVERVIAGDCFML